MHTTHNINIIKSNKIPKLIISTDYGSVISKSVFEVQNIISQKTFCLKKEIRSSFETVQRSKVISFLSDAWPLFPNNFYQKMNVNT